MGRSRAKQLGLAGVVLVAAAALLAAACGDGASSKDKTATAAAKPAATTAATKPAATKAAATSAATSAATKAATTAAAGVTTMATAASGATGVKVADSRLGKILVDAKGFTLYTFKNDVVGSGKSAAEGLTAAWPPLSLDAAPSGVAGATGAWAVFTRVDGKRQVTYKGMPLYFFANDKAPGDTNGDKLANIWFVAVP